MISALTWVPRNAARSRPMRFEISPEEYARIKALAREEEEASAAAASFEPVAGTAGANGDEEVDEEVDTSDLPPELRMESYDDDEDDDAAGDEDMDAAERDDADGYEIIEEADKAYALEVDSEDEDAEDDEIRPTDSLLVVAMTDPEDEFSHLEVQLMTGDGDMFVHHDISLPDFPLCLAWTDCPPFQWEGGQQQAVGNYIAVGTFTPGIEIWNLDVLDPLEPTAMLGGYVNESIKGKKKNKKKKGQEKKLKPGSHEEAVMALSWNRIYRQAMASGSADCTTKIWDITTQACSHTFTHHTDKVQSVQFHGDEAWLLATGSFDRTVALLDCRTASLTTRYTMPADIESLAWNPFCQYHLYCAQESGAVSCIDIRHPSGPLFTFQAHDKTASGLSFSSAVPGMVATSSVDKTVKVWDVLHCQEAYAAVSSGAAGTGLTAAMAPRLVAYKSMNVGKLFALQYYYGDAGSPYLMACGGDKGMVAVWESDEQAIITEHFAGRTATKLAASSYEGLTSGAMGPGAEVATAAVEMEGDEGEDGGEGDGSSGQQKKKKDKKKKNKK